MTAAAVLESGVRPGSPRDPAVMFDWNGWQLEASDAGAGGVAMKIRGLRGIKTGGCGEGVEPAD